MLASATSTAVDVASALVYIVGAAAPFVAVALALVRRPKIRFRPHDWTAAVPVEWQFAAAHLRNQEPQSWIPLAGRDAALWCRGEIEFRQDGQLVVGPVPARWSARPEPLRHEPLSDRSGRIIVVALAAPELVGASEEYDLPAGGRWEEIAVAVRRGDEAYAWGSTSYFHDEWRNPEWELEPGIYEVKLMLTFSGGTAEQNFTLEWTGNKDDPFRLS